MARYLNQAEPDSLKTEVPEDFLPAGYKVKPAARGFWTLTTPSGQEVSLTPEEEKEIVRETLKESLKLQMTGSERRKEAIISSAIGAAGYAVGLGLASLALGLLFRKMGAGQPKLPGIGSTE